MRHLDDDTIAALLDGTLAPAELDTWRAHLRTGCADCEAACAEGPDLDVLARLLDAEGSSPLAPDAATRARIAAAVVPMVPANRAWVGWAGLALVAAAALVVVIGGPLSSSPETVPDLTEKGVLLAPAVELDVLAAHVEGGRVVVDGRAGADGPVARSQLLLFHLSTDVPAARFVWVTVGGGPPEFLAPARGVAPIEPAGPRRVGTPEVAYDLSDVTATEVRVWAAASKVPLAPSDALQAAERGLPGVSVTSIRLELTP